MLDWAPGVRCGPSFDHPVAGREGLLTPLEGVEGAAPTIGSHGEFLGFRLSQKDTWRLPRVGVGGETPGRVIESGEFKREKEECVRLGMVGWEVRSKEPQVKSNHSGWNRRARWVYEGTCSTLRRGHIPCRDLSVRAGKQTTFGGSRFHCGPLATGVLNSDLCSTCKPLNKYPSDAGKIESAGGKGP